MTTLQRLLTYPHAAVFDKGPDGDLALRIRHQDGADWSVAEEVLTVTAGALSRTYDLATLTIADLAGLLQADGFEPEVADGWGSRSALVLAEGSGRQFDSNGDRLMAFRSLMWVLMSGYAGEVREARTQVREALRQMVLTTSEGEWLDLWGALYGVSRKEGEQDTAYAPRIVAEAFRVRVNGHGIEKAVLDATGRDVRIEEPWRDLFVLDESVLSGPHKMHDGIRYGYHMIRPVTRESVNWDEILPVVNRNRAAGVLVVECRSLHVSYIDASTELALHVANTHLARDLVRYEGSVLLDYMAIEDVPILNHASRKIRNVLRSSESIVDASQYAVTAAHARTYRVYFLSADYAGQYWSGVTWEGTNGGTWEMDAVILSAHSRSS